MDTDNLLTGEASRRGVPPTNLALPGTFLALLVGGLSLAPIGGCSDSGATSASLPCTFPDAGLESADAGSESCLIHEEVNLAEDPDGVVYRLPPGYTLSHRDWAIDVPDDPYGAPDFISFQVHARTPYGEGSDSLIRLATSLYPPESEEFPGWGGPGKWWLNGPTEPDGSFLAGCPRLPTRAALDYYRTALTELSQEAALETDPDRPFYGLLRYVIDVALREDMWIGGCAIGRAYVITIEFESYWSCGGLCGYSMVAPLHRTVVVGDDNTVLLVHDSGRLGCGIS